MASPHGSVARLLPPVTTASAKLAVAILVTSILWALTRDGIGDWIALSPLAVREQGALWQLATYALLATDPLGVMFGAFLTWSLGGWLEARWGSRRMLLFVLGISAAAGALTVLASLFWPAVALSRFHGAHVMTAVLWVAYGLTLRHAQVSFFGIPMTGDQFALVGVAWAALAAIFGSPVAVVPEAFALAMTYFYIRTDVASPRTWWLRLQGALIERRMKRRSRHLTLLDQERNTPSDSDRYLH